VRAIRTNDPLPLHTHTYAHTRTQPRASSAHLTCILNACVQLRSRASYRSASPITCGFTRRSRHRGPNSIYLVRAPSTESNRKNDEENEELNFLSTYCPLKEIRQRRTYARRGATDLTSSSNAARITRRPPSPETHSRYLDYRYSRVAGSRDSAHVKPTREAALDIETTISSYRRIDLITLFCRRRVASKSSFSLKVNSTVCGFPSGTRILAKTRYSVGYQRKVACLLPSIENIFVALLIHNGWHVRAGR